MGLANLRLLATAGLLLAFGGAPVPPERSTGPDVYRQTLRGTVLIVAAGKSKGTAWLLDRERRLIVTNFHVVGDHDALDVIFPTFEGDELITRRSYYVEDRRSLERAGRLVRGRVLHREQDCDLALIELASLPKDAEPLALAREGARPGDLVHAIGNRGDLDTLWVHATGTVRQAYRTQEGYFWQGWHLSKGARIVETQAPINDGDSGAPLVNAHGDLVGVLAAVKWQAQGASVGIDVSEVKAFLTRARQTVPPPPREQRPETGDAPAGRQIYAQLLRATAWVKTSASSNRATGWLLDRERKLLAACHQAIGSQDAVEVVFPVFQSGQVVAEHRFYRDNERLLRERGHQVRGRVLARDLRRNLVLIELDAVPADAVEVPLADAAPRPGERLHTIGNPNGIEALWVCTTGTVRQLGYANLGPPDEKPDPAVILAQLPGSAGDSGGPVVNDAGRLVGMVTGKEAPQQQVSNCLSVGEVRAFVRENRPRWDPRTAEEYRQRGAFHLRTGRPERALADYGVALRLEPNDALLHSDRAEVHRRAGTLDQALADCNEALRLDPRLPAALARRAAVWNDRNEPDRARADCGAALKIDPKCAAALSHRGHAHLLKGDLDRALADCDEAIWLDARLASACCHRGLVLLAKGDLDRALADLGRAIELDPSSAPAHRARGEVHRLKNDADKALADCTRALELNPRDAAAHHGRGLAFALKERHEQAVAEFTQALKLDARFAPALAGRGTSRMRQGDLDRALADYADALRLRPSLAGEVVRDVSRRAAELGAGERADVARCCELCKRVLVLMQSLFKQRADVKKVSREGLAAAEREPDLRERAQVLRAALGELRELLNSRPPQGSGR